MKIDKIMALAISLTLVFTSIVIVTGDDFEPMSPTEIYTIDDLYAIRHNLSGNYILMNDLDFQNDSHYVNATASKTGNTTGSGWLPIGIFTGTFDGQNYTISNLYINRNMTNDIGLFGIINGEIYNLILSNVDVLGGANVGSLVGYLEGGIIINCGVESGTITSTLNYAGGLIGSSDYGSINSCFSLVDVIFDDSLNPTQGIAFGGLIGHLQWSSVEDCYATGAISTYFLAGGLIGEAYDGDYVNDSYATGDVTTTSSNSIAGGLVGITRSFIYNNCSATGLVLSGYKAGGFTGECDYDDFFNCYAIGDVEGVEYVGGFIGDLYSENVPLDVKIINCYSNGNVTRNSGTGTYIGGFVGRNRFGIIHYCYSTGYVSCGTNTNKGFSGAVSTGTPYSEIGTFFDNETSGQLTTAGNGTGKNTSDMQTITTFSNAGWDIALYGDWDGETWYIENPSDYPRLGWEYIPMDEWDHKMHFPQLPDPNGWDVHTMYWYDEMEQGWVYETPLLADDWMCSETGFVTNITWWGSWDMDMIGDIIGFNVSIWSDVPANESMYGYSMPGMMLWEDFFDIYMINITEEPPSLQGWYAPDPEYPYVDPGNHIMYFRYDLNNIFDPFYQENGTIYWLNVMPFVAYNESRGGPSGAWGWKTSLDHWNDEAVYGYDFDGWIWFNMTDPITNESLDLAFIIDGSPLDEPPEYGDNTTFPDAKMHYPQYPDPYGWDVDFWNLMLADDWMCNETGYVTDIHFWISWYNDTEAWEYLSGINISIWSDNPASGDNHSTPDIELWNKEFTTFNISGPFYGEEGFYSPDINRWEENNHFKFYRIDIENITEPFIQFNGTIYWLEINMPFSPMEEWLVGWKTTTDNWNDAAVWAFVPDEGELQWYNLSDPITNESLDFAFVITGEPLEYGDPIQFPNAKMHFPQYPDPLGMDVAWDVTYNSSISLGDDWLCTETGVISDIHFWISTYNDTGIDPFHPIAIKIFSDNSSGNYSHPEELLWTYWDYQPDIAGPFYGDQGWYIPHEDIYYPNNHQLFWRFDITNITKPFIQQNGTVYWLVLDINSIDYQGYEWGWKTSLEHWNDNAVWGDFIYIGYPLYTWHPLWNPVNQSQQVDFAFVVNSSPFPGYGDNTTFPNAKMHFPQMPDPYGWDVDFASYSSVPMERMLADDWMCNFTGEVTDIHFWVSSMQDYYGHDYILQCMNDRLEIYIFSDNSTGNYSHPEVLLWNSSYSTYDLELAGPYYGLQGWYEPYGDYYYEDDHMFFWRVDITNISAPFIQTNGTMYWLVLSVTDYPHVIGWKTSQDHFMDDAVFWHEGLGIWVNMTDPINASEPIDLAFVISGEPLEYGDPTEFPDHKMHYPQYPDPYGWDVDWVSPDWQGLNLLLADDWMCTKSGNVTDVHFWLSTYGDEYDYNDIWAALVSDNFIFAFMSDNPGPPYSHPENVLAVYYDGYDINLSGPYYGDQGWLIPDYDHEEHNHNQFWRVDITNFTYPFYQEFGTIYWLGIACWSLYTDPYVFGWKTTDYNFNDNAVYGGVGEWYPLYDPITNESLDLAFVISGEPLPPDVVYVDDDFDISTPGWGYDHFDNIPDAIENVTEGGLVYVYNGIHTNPAAPNLPNPPGHTTNILIQKSITLRGESQEHTIVDAQGLRNAIMVNCSTGTVTIENLHIVNWTARGIAQYMEWQPLIARNNTLRGTEWATAAGNGITFSGNYSIIENNTIYGIQHPSSDGTGILSFSASHSIIRNNYITNNAVAGVGIAVVSYFYSAPTYVWNLYGINNTVENNTLLNFSSYGILVQGWVFDTTIRNNDISNSTRGIIVTSINFGGIDKIPENITIGYNDVYDIRQNGIRITDANNVLIENNNIYDCNWSGINIDASNATIHSNTVTDNILYGIEMVEGGNTIYNNYFDNNINAFDSSAGNTWNITKTMAYNPIFVEDDINNPVFAGLTRAYYPTMLYEDDMYKMWYDDSGGLGYTTSSDGLNWSTPVLVTGLTNPAHAVVKNISGQYRIWYWDTAQLYSINAIRTANSSDGINWVDDQVIQQNGTTVITGSSTPPHDLNRGSYGPSDILYNPDGSETLVEPVNESTIWANKYVMYYDGTTGGVQNTFLAVSADGIYWHGFLNGGYENGSAPVLAMGGTGTWDATHLSARSILKVDDGYYIWYSGGDGAGNHGIGQAFSADGINWMKDINNPILHKDDGVGWRDTRTYTPWLVKNESSDEYWLYYNGRTGSAYTIGRALLSTFSGTNIIGGLYLGGNYWSDYPGEDTNNDSIGDTFLPYNNSIYVGGDYLPLTPMANQPPDIPVLLSPANNTDYGTVYARYFNCSIYDADNDSLTVYFYWGNDTLFGTIHNATNGNVSLDRMFAGIWWLQHDTTYYWYVIVDDGLLQNRSETWSYHTSMAWDVNEDGVVNYLDVSALVSNYGLSGYLFGELPADIIEDGKVDYLDVSSLVSHYGESY